MPRWTICTVAAAFILTAAQAAYAGGGFTHGVGNVVGTNVGPSTTAPVLNAGLYPMPVQNVPPRIGGTYITNPAFYPHEYLYAHQHHYLAPPFYYVKHSGPFSFLKHHHKNKCGYCEDECGYCEDACPRCGSPGCNGKCKLRGTEVVVKYKSRRHWFKTLFLPPRSGRSCWH